MKIAIVFAICIATAFAATAVLNPDGTTSVITNITWVPKDTNLRESYKVNKAVQEPTNNPIFLYFSYSTDDGSAREEAGQLVDENLSVKGSFQFVGDDGQTYKVNFVADENGYRPEGAHIPVVPQK